MPLFSRGPQCQTCHLVSSVLSCPTGILWPLCMDQHLQQPDRGLLCPQWCQSQLIPALGGGIHCHRFLLPRQYLALTSGLGHSTWAGWSEDARGWPGTCRPTLHFPAGSVAWPGKGYQCHERELESHTHRAGVYRRRRTCMPSPGPPAHRSSLWWEPACTFLSPFLSPAHAGKNSIPCVVPSSSPSPHCPSPRRAWDSQSSLAGGHMTQACGLAQSAFSSLVV